MKNSEPLSDHPLFRALVLMGGGLALSCGGVARTERDAPESGGSSGATTETGGAGPSVVITVPGGATSTTDGGGGISVGPGMPVPPKLGPYTGTLGCPSEQWDCSANMPTGCSLDLTALQAAGSCACDPSRPTSAKACKANENFVCLQGYAGSMESVPATWDYSVHVQCACIASPTPATYDSCDTACRQAYPNRDTAWFRCLLPSPCSDYQADGSCTATSADVLRQDGIMCGCADIGLK